MITRVDSIGPRVRDVLVASKGVGCISEQAISPATIRLDLARCAAYWPELFETSTRKHP